MHKWLLPIQHLKQNFCLYWSIDRYGPDPGSQATFDSGHKITVLIWPDCLSKGLSTLDVQKVFRKKIQKNNFCFKDLLRYFNSVVSQINFS